MKIIYIAGPYRDTRGTYYVMMNMRWAEECALFVWRNGGVAVCPHKNTQWFDGYAGLPDDVWLEGDLELVAHCDAIFAIRGWRQSEGATMEVKQALACGLPVLESFEVVKEYLRNE